MNLEYLNSLPAIINKYRIYLENDEKVIFTSLPSCFETEEGRFLGEEPKLTLTNKKLIIDNGIGIWTIDIEDDVVGYKKIEKGKWLWKSSYLQIDINHEIRFHDNREVLTGFRFYFKKKDMHKFEEIMNNLFKN